MKRKILWAVVFVMFMSFIPITNTEVNADTIPITSEPTTESTTTTTTKAPTTTKKSPTTKATTTTSSGIKTYPIPSKMKKYKNVTLKAGKKNIDLYSVKVNNYHAFSNDPDKWNMRTDAPVAMFDMTGNCTFTLTLKTKPKSAVVRPIAAGVKAKISGKTITFTLKKAGQYSIEWNGSHENALMLFANEPFNERDVPEGATVLGKGIHKGNDLNHIYLAKNEVLYLKPGAVVQASIFMSDGSKIIGRGIIDCSVYTNWLQNNNNAIIPIRVESAKNVTIKDVAMFDPNGWCVQVLNSKNISFDNIKIISSRSNGDGVSIQSSTYVTVKNSFIRSWDDSIVVKNYTDINSHNITIKNNILWTDLAQSLEIGAETNKNAHKNPKIYNCKFTDITILHAIHKAPISIHNCDNAKIYKITYNNIVLEDAQMKPDGGDGWNYLVDITNLTGGAMGGASSWTRVQDRGSISNVTISNVKVLAGKKPTARFDSYQGGKITGIKLRNITYKGKYLNLLKTMKGFNKPVGKKCYKITSKKK